MVIDELELDTDEREGRATQRFRVRMDRGDHLVEVTVPANMTLAMPDDATPALPLGLLLAMRLGEDLNVGGWVDPDLHDRLDLIQAHYHAMDPSLDFVRVEVAGRLDASQPRSAFAGSCLSRGVDSLYACAQGRTAAGLIDCAVFVDGLEPIHDRAVREKELELAQRAAEALGLPLVVVEAPNLRTLTDPIFDWDDAFGAGLAWIGHAVSGGLSRLVVPSSDSVHTLGPCGSSPVLDSLFSSRRLQIEHADVVATRMEKVDWLATHRPDLLPLLKVCYSENRSDNCGRCHKCLHTMACLRIAGALDKATAFPPKLDLEALVCLTPNRQLLVRHSYAKLRGAALEVGDHELAEAITSMIERTAAASTSDERQQNTFRTAHMAALTTLLRTWQPEFAGPRYVESEAYIGLLRVLDLRARRHSYTTGGSCSEVLTAELGAMVAPGYEGEIPVWTLGDGRVVTDRYVPGNPGAGSWARARFCVRPLRSGGHPMARRVRLAFRRVVDAFFLRPPTPACVPESSGPVGYLFEAPREGRVALWSGVHPVLGDQLLSWSSEAIAGAGYKDPSLLGFLVAKAPHTGRLGTHAMELVPWAGAGQAILDSP